MIALSACRFAPRPIPPPLPRLLHEHPLDFVDVTVGDGEPVGKHKMHFRVRGEERCVPAMSETSEERIDEQKRASEASVGKAILVCRQAVCRFAPSSASPHRLGNCPDYTPAVIDINKDRLAYNHGCQPQFVAFLDLSR